MRWERKFLVYQARATTVSSTPRPLAEEHCGCSDMKLSDGAKAGSSSSSVRLSRKLGTCSPENKCVQEPAPPVTPSSPASLPLGFQPPSFYTAHSVCTARCLASLAPPFQAHSLSHTPELCLPWQLLCLLPEFAGLPLAKHNEAQPGRARFQAQAAPCTGLLL